MENNFETYIKNNNAENLIVHVCSYRIIRTTSYPKKHVKSNRKIIVGMWFTPSEKENIRECHKTFLRLCKAEKTRRKNLKLTDNSIHYHYKIEEFYYGINLLDYWNYNKNCDTTSMFNVKFNILHVIGENKR